MLPVRLFWGVCLATAIFTFTKPAFGDTYHVIVSGTVTMEDGLLPPFTVGISGLALTSRAQPLGPSR